MGASTENYEQVRRLTTDAHFQGWRRRLITLPSRAPAQDHRRLSPSIHRLVRQVFSYFIHVAICTPSHPISIIDRRSPCTKYLSFEQNFVQRTTPGYTSKTCSACLIPCSQAFPCCKATRKKPRRASATHTVAPALSIMQFRRRFAASCRRSHRVFSNDSFSTIRSAVLLFTPLIKCNSLGSAIPPNSTR